MSGLYLYDDEHARTFEPFALTRPLSELRAGAELIRGRWEAALGVAARGTVSASHLADFEEIGAAPVHQGPIAARSVIANTRCVVALGWRGRDADVWLCAGRVAAVRVGQEVQPEELAGGAVALEALGASGTRVEEISGRWVPEVWSLLTDLVPQLTEDIAALGPQLDCVAPEQAIVIGAHEIYVERGATIEPHACLDAGAGPVLVRRGAIVRAFTRLVGPCVVGADAMVVGDRVAACSIGERCVVRGELSESIVLGHANKAHDGFVGHSYLGRWVNLGAGTITSNLKNTYGTVTLWTPAGLRDTGVLKLGTMFGDHVKTGIGLRLTTGTVIGAGSNLYGSAMPPKYVPPFSWGEGAELRAYDRDRFLGVAARAMARRDVELNDRGRRWLTAAYDRGRGTAR